MNITRENIDPFIDVPTGKEATVDAWLSAISAILTSRYSAKPTPDPDPVPPAIAPAVYEIVANAIQDRLDQPSTRDPRIKAQAVAGASVQYFDSAQFTGWFGPFSMATLNDLFGVGSVRSVRTPAPDVARYGNLYRDDFIEDMVIPIESVI